MTKWRPIPGMKGNYFVSDDGQVYGRKRRGSRGGVMKPYVDSRGYSSVNLSNGGSSRTCRIHHLMLEAFVGPRPDKADTRHLDGDPTNNLLSNLAWGTRSENVRDAVRHGTHRNANTDKSECIHGHPFDELNTYIAPTGTRRCRECRRHAKRRHRLRAAQLGRENT